VKFLIYGNAPTAPTGYGIQIAHLATRLKRDGHDVAVACNWGHTNGIKDWPTEHGPVRLYFQGLLDQSVDILAAHVDHWFDGDRKAGKVIVLNDLWALDSGIIPWEDLDVLAWCPVDHWPVPKGVLNFFHRSQARPVAMSRFGENLLNEGALDALYAPLAIDTAIYRPTPVLEVGDTVVDSRKLFDIPASAFVVLMVAMNKDPQDRKNFDGAFRAFGRFWKDHKESVLVVHTDPSGMYGGMNLHELAKHAAIPPHALIFTNAYAQRTGFTSEMMAALYTAANVLLAPSKGEGFGVPMVEAQACGTPVIASDFTAQSELVGAGWKLSGQLLWDPHQSATYFQAFHQDIFDKLHEAHDADLPALSAQAVEWAQRYDADRVFDEFWRPIIRSFEPVAPVVKPRMERCDVIVPCVREANRTRLFESFYATHHDNRAEILVTENGEPTCS
jgi:glycosyltransferase involved in cell wall biosynthesis